MSLRGRQIDDLFGEDGNDCGDTVGGNVVVRFRIRDTRSKLFGIEHVFTFRECIGGGCVRVSDVRVGMIFNGVMYGDGFRVQFNDTRAGFKMGEIAFLVNLDCSKSLLKSFECTDVVAACIFV